ncbi:hypothetical protein HPB52_017914 [Rhipicephalus sanguineus]|uniref:Uncharacterized protein n=1 Tax=Rhipicephalus sanguineus TaxID=34632 RepID=A0A9D4Q1I4_RHISA|nr:hypothetical protein HPB52_017914 [Rhipicephalus sanguineus]
MVAAFAGFSECPFVQLDSWLIEGDLRSSSSPHRVAFLGLLAFAAAQVQLQEQFPPHPYTFSYESTGFRVSIDTNEPGTKAENPADVTLNANPIEVPATAYTFGKSKS